MNKSNKKDPGFLFYTRDFYEGTRMMLPEERACYIDLLIFQHQNGGFIPNDPKRLVMYCSGISEATLKATLEAKFKLCDKGWFNQKLANVIEERAEFTEKQSVNGTVGQFFKKAKAILNKRDFQKLQSIYNQFPKKDLFDLISNKSIDEAMLQAMLKAELKHLADANAIGDADANAIGDADVLGKGGAGEKPFLEDPKKPGPRKKQTTQPDFPFSEAFRPIWDAWKDYRKEIKSPVKPASEGEALRLLHKLAGGKESEAEAIIRQSIAQGWQGLFELKSNGSPNGSLGGRPMTENQRLNDIARNGGHLKIDENNRVKVVGSIIQGSMDLDADGNMVLYCGSETLRIYPADNYRGNKLYEVMYGRTIQQVHAYLLEQQNGKLKTA